MTDGAAEPAGRVQRLARRPLEHVNGVVRGVARALPRAIEDMFSDRCTQYAAAIAYRVLFSLFPLTIALVSIFGLVLQDDELRQSVINELIDYLPVSESGQAGRPSLPVRKRSRKPPRLPPVGGAAVSASPSGLAKNRPSK